jgi:hypothetical protein
MAYKVHKLGPGTLTVGEVGAVIDISCQINNAVVEWDKDKDDDQTVLCGDVVPGSTTYTATLSGNLFQDLDDGDGIVAFSWANKGNAYPFEFVPNTAVGATVAGSVVVDPISVGGDEMKANMASDFEWDIVGEPTLTMGPSVPATGATAGTPGTWTPSGADPPATVADLIAGVPNTVTASPASAWTTGQYVETADLADAHWSGSAWVAGPAT